MSALMKAVWLATGLVLLVTIVQTPVVILYFVGYCALLWVLEKALGESKPQP